MAIHTRPFLAAGLRMRAVGREVGVYERALACKKSTCGRIRDMLASGIQQVSRPIQPRAVSDNLQEAAKMHSVSRCLLVTSAAQRSCW
jgi:hypothetical protein